MLRDALADQPAVGFDLGFARAAEKAEAAALALQMGPASDQPAALIGQMGELDLKAPFPRLRALAEDLQDQRCAVEHLHVPGALEIALLHGRKLRVDDDDFRLERHALRRRSPRPCRGRSVSPASSAPALRHARPRHRARWRRSARRPRPAAIGHRGPASLGLDAPLMRDMKDKGAARARAFRRARFWLALFRRFPSRRSRSPAAGSDPAA